jgi:Flp pilus assembly protein TadG
MDICFAEGAMKIEQNHSREQGAVLVETAVTILMFLVVLFAIFEIGRMLNIQQTLTNAAREGARLSVTPLSGTDTLATPDAVRTRVRTFLNAAGLNGYSVSDDDIVIEQSYDPNTGDTDPTTYTRVTVTVPYRVLTSSIFSLLEVNLRGRAMMRNETNLQ